MRRHKTYLNLDAGDRGASAAMGNFDGVHLGHQSVIALARAAAAQANAPLGIVTFEPHPREFFAPNAPDFRLMNAESRAHRLQKMGIEQLYELPFDAQLAGMSAEEFVNVVLADGLGLSHIVVGADFRFGKGRQGDAATLREYCDALGIRTTIAPLVTASGLDVSSTAIREALSAGRPDEAARMLGHWHRIDGVVEKGDQRGRDLGFPTANLRLDGLHLPRFGVYAVLFDVLTGPHKGNYVGAASLGIRPTFGINAPNLETHVLDFEGDLYGAEVSVALVSFLRGEVAYEGPEPLIAQMRKDVIQTRAALDQLR